MLRYGLRLARLPRRRRRAGQRARANPNPNPSPNPNPNPTPNQASALEALLLEASDDGRLPIVCDTSPCLQRMKEKFESPLLKCAIYEPNPTPNPTPSQARG